MTAQTHAPVASMTRTAPRQVMRWLPLVLAMGSAAAYAVFFLLPYYANDLDSFSLEEVAGGLHDPKDLWPFNQGSVGGVFMLGAYFTMLLSPFVAAAAAGWAVFDIWRSRQSRDVRRNAPGILTVAFAALTWAWLASPLGGALIAWLLD